MPTGSSRTSGKPLPARAVGDVYFAAAITFDTESIEAPNLVISAGLMLIDDLNYHGNLTVASNAEMKIAGELTLSGTGTLDGSMYGQGAITIAGGDVVVDAYMGLKSLTVSAGTLEISGAFAGDGFTEVAGVLTEAADAAIDIRSAGFSLYGTQVHKYPLPTTATFDGAVTGDGDLLVGSGASMTVNAGAMLSMASWTLDAGSATIDEALTYSGDLSVSGTLTLSAPATSPLVLKGGNDFSMGTVKGVGEVELDGATTIASQLTIDGTVTFDVAGAASQLSENLILSGVKGGASNLSIAATGVYDLENGCGIYSDAATAKINNAGLLENLLSTGENPVESNIVNTGEILAATGIFDLSGSVTGTGTAVVDAGATLDFGGSVGSGQTASFSGSGGELQVLASGNNNNFQGVISGYGVDDLIDVGAPYADNNSLSYLFTVNSQNTGGTLRLTEGTETASISFAGAGLSNADFTPQTDGHGGTLFKF